MEKLIELLNEYDGYSIEYSGEGFIQNGKTISMVRKFEDCPGFTYYENWDSNLISKQFGFIKWLVDNDKIKKDLISRVLVHAYVSPETLVSLECEFYDYYESLLMILSIQDNPLDFLVKILK